jgi:hypothetical protein
MSAPGMPSENPRRAVAMRLLAVTGAIGVGLGLQQLLASRLEAIEALARDDVIAARAELAGLLRVVAVLVFGATAGVGVSMLLACRRALETERFPPPGAWSYGAVRIATGPRARRLARLGTALAVALVGLSAACGGLMWILGARLLACRAGAG